MAKNTVGGIGPKMGSQHESVGESMAAATAKGRSGSKAAGARDAPAPHPGEAPEVVAAGAPGPALILCEHASRHIPARYRGLGLATDARDSHAAWDRGAREVALRLARMLDSPLVAARVSRLVHDCNRPPDADSAMPDRVERIEVPGNRNLSPADRAERVARVYRPFCAAVAGLIDARTAAGRPTALVTVHSFSPDWFGVPRATEIGLLHDSDTRLADAMLERAASVLPQRAVARNAPYGPEDGVTHSLRRFGLERGLPNVMIEIRNDLLADSAGCGGLAGEVLTLLRPALRAALPAGCAVTATDLREGGDDA